MLTLDADTTDNTFDSTLCSPILDIEIDKNVRVFPIFFTIVATELDNAFKVFGIDFTIFATELDNATIVVDMDLPTVEVDATFRLKEIR